MTDSPLRQAMWREEEKGAGRGSSVVNMLGNVEETRALIPRSSNLSVSPGCCLCRLMGVGSDVCFRERADFCRYAANPRCVVLVTGAQCKVPNPLSESNARGDWATGRISHAKRGWSDVESASGASQLCERAKRRFTRRVESEHSSPPPHGTSG